MDRRAGRSLPSGRVRQGVSRDRPPRCLPRDALGRPSKGLAGHRMQLSSVDIAPMSKFREHDLRTFNRVDASVVSHPEAPGIRRSRKEPNVALGPSTPGILPQDLKRCSEPSLNVAWQFSKFPLRAARKLDFEVGQRIASEVEFLSNLGPSPSGLPVQPPQVFEEEFLGWVGVEEIVEQPIVADAPNLVASEPAQSLRADRECRVRTCLGSHRSHGLHGIHYTYR